MTSVRCLRPLAEFSVQRTSSIVHRPFSFAITSMRYDSFRHPSKTKTSSELRSQYTPLVGQRAAYSTTPSNLSSSPFRLKYVPNKAQSDASFDEHTQSEQADGGEGGTNYYSPHKPKRQWPPDMSKLSPKHQLRLERKYRRRAALKYARPQWVKATKLMQWGVIIFVVIYSVLFMEWGKEGEQHPLEGFRKDFFSSLQSLSATSRPPSRKSADE